jgi:filamentous hemagglutinin family protein
MNKSFRSVWNASKQAYVAAAETVSAKGKPSSSVKVAALVGGLMGTLLATGSQAQTAPPPTALPTGGQVSAGVARIGQTGANLLIQQSTDRAAINWNTFNVGKDAKVQFEQPNASSVTLNRVLSNDPSQIFGQITANGQVILTNPSGVFFGKDARVDVGGLIATTHSISDADFMAGNTRFERNGSTASVVNEGELKSALGGFIALLAPEVRNQGAVIAQMGTVALAAGEAFDLKFDSNNRLTSLRVEASQIKALVDNRLAVQAPGGLVIISAQSMDRLVGGVVNNSGAIEATGLQQLGGRIVLSGSTRVQNAGILDASSTEAAGKGGSISVQGDSIDLQSSSRISDTGPAGGGTVLVGGNWQGSTDPLLQATAQPTAAATNLNLASGATIDASATQNGDGGKVVLWSEKTTDFAGRIAALGAGLKGTGGNAEVSGKTQLNYTGQTNLLGSQGGGTSNLLLDP